MRVRAGRTLLESALRELLENALKFCARRAGTGPGQRPWGHARP
jgi:signal transduction histidine kinase